jgi:hypothetical protein
MIERERKESLTGAASGEGSWHVDGLLLSRPHGGSYFPFNEELDLVESRCRWLTRSEPCRAARAELPYACVGACHGEPCRSSGGSRTPRCPRWRLGYTLLDGEFGGRGQEQAYGITAMATMLHEVAHPRGFVEAIEERG